MDDSADVSDSPKAEGWYPATEPRRVRYWDGGRWIGSPMRANRWGSGPRDRLGWVGLWLVIAGGAGIALLVFAALFRADRPADGSSGLPYPGLALFAAVLVAGTVCGIIGSIRADSHHYTSPQARAAFKVGGGMIGIAIAFALVGLAILSLGIVVAVIIVVLALLVLGLLFLFS